MVCNVSGNSSKLSASASCQHQSSLLSHMLMLAEVAVVVVLDVVMEHNQLRTVSPFSHAVPVSKCCICCTFCKASNGVDMPLHLLMLCL
jgi:hypothetical protein